MSMDMRVRSTSNAQADHICSTMPVALRYSTHFSSPTWRTVTRYRSMFSCLLNLPPHLVREIASNMFKKIAFQLHWLMGITAGIVLAIVGVTGAALSFQDELLEALNRGVLTISPQSPPPLRMHELV